MSAQVIYQQVSLVVRNCPECGIPYAVPDYFIPQRQKDHKTFYCPNGHQRYFPEGESEAARLRRMLEDATRSKSAIAAQLIDTQAALKKAEKKVKQVNTRVHAGVCPCCNRTFQNLARHMAAKHKDEKV